jgi:hypothetical protein
MVTMKWLVMITLSLGAGAGLLAYASYHTTRWGGSCGYGQREYQLTFIDSSGNVVEGVELKVEDERGNEFFYFPVSDYSPGQVPTSDQQGVMRFHHVSTAVEWDDYGWALFWLVPVTTVPSPVFICRFVHRGKEVYRIPYGELPDWDWPGRGWEDVSKVKRRWNWLAITPPELVPHPGESEEDYDARLDLFFHVDRQDKRHREGVIARRNACRQFERFGPGQGTPDSVEDPEFPVIRRTITLPVGGRD